MRKIENKLTGQGYTPSIIDLQPKISVKNASELRSFAPLATSNGKDYHKEKLTATRDYMKIEISNVTVCEQTFVSPDIPGYNPHPPRRKTHSPGVRRTKRSNSLPPSLTFSA